MNTLLKHHISVVIPTFKREIELNRALKSLNEQTFKDFEVVVVNDDRSVEKLTYVGDYGLDIKWVNSTRKKGACGARNTGILESSGNLIAFLDDDDEWLPHKLERQILHLNEFNNGFGLIGTGFVIPDGHKKNDAYLDCVTGNVFEELLGKTKRRAPKLSSVMVPKEILLEIGMFDEDLLSRQDLDLYLRIAKKYKFFHIPEVLVISNKNSADRISKDYSKKIQGYTHLLEKYKDDLAKHPLARQKYLNDYAIVLLRHGAYSRAYEFYKESRSSNNLLRFLRIAVKVVGIENLKRLKRKFL